MRGRRWSLAVRLTIWYASAAFLLVAGAALVQYRSLRTSLANEDDRDLLARLNAVVRASPEERAVQAEDRDGATVIRLFAAGCRPLQPLSPDQPPPLCGDGSGRARVLQAWGSATNTRWRSAGAMVGAPPGAWVEVLLNRSSDEVVLRAYRQELLLVLAAALLAAAAIGYGIARRGLRPLSSLAARVSQIDARSLERRLSDADDALVQPIELQALVASFDQMLTRLERAFRALTEFSAELAHELRTPIHVLRQQAEVALQRDRTREEYRDILGSSLEELARMRRMVDDILFLARAEDPRSAIDVSQLRLADEVAQVLAFLAADAVERDVALESRVPGDLALPADRLLLRRALVNVLGNALRHTPPGGRVDVSAYDCDDTIAVRVDDTGEGIAPELLPFVFDRHVRGVEARVRHPEGAGLGLAVVRGIMALHHGSATASRKPDGGTLLTLVFPARPIGPMPAVPHAHTSLGVHPLTGEAATNASP